MESCKAFWPDSTLSCKVTSFKVIVATGIESIVEFTLAVNVMFLMKGATTALWYV